MKPLRIGTRKSPLALWQAKEVEKKLNQLNIPTEIIPITSIGDKNLIQPLYEMNIVGVFTRDLDLALLNNEIDIAVHSLKDVPTILPKGIVLSAVLKRDYEADILVRNPKTNSTLKKFDGLHIGTGSLRRRAFWNAKYPNVNFHNLRGNLQTRLSKLETENLDGTIFSLAGIKRLNLNIDYEVLDFIIPAPGQGVVAISSLESNKEITNLMDTINHKETQICTEIERDFLNSLEGGCTAPIAAYAKIENESIIFKGGIVSLDGSKKLILEKKVPINKYSDLGKTLGKEAFEQGGNEIIKEFKTKN
ncbi:hydroxymethylbilane synthase [Apibacter muscae]|uniref:Hydroxymethylbilane synthase n=1 Tax=Apibacter muscae TaxID=2509004 RepID=A0A563DJ62_9FLAO|nr:hydroxymethylbilane synthase [Apibacter muscae]TWP29913.1 hydroxymethylbilane synthase [Apibacter muscae]TWP31067.1 hydroxymethylbilane synthase [Apibacter muscae]